jgi:hypothetical protein
MGKHLIPRIHDLKNIFSIIIFCGYKSYYEEWSKDYPKVKLVADAFNDLLLPL